MKVFVSNKLSELAQALQENLFSPLNHPLKTQWLIVPSKEVKLDLYLKWLETQPIVAGIKTMTYHELVQTIFPELPCPMELSLRIEACIGDIPELENYLRDRNILKKIELAQVIAHLFLKYLERAPEELLVWLGQEGWQQKLWKKIWGPDLPTAKPLLMKGSFFFYHPTSITSYEWKAFSLMNTSWFLFSPSEMYIGDLLSERKKLFLIRQAEKTESDNIETYFEQESPLLSNWIEQGQQLFRYFEDAERCERYCPQTPLTSLHKLQYEWLTLQKEHSTPDTSLQLHSVSNALHEVSVVWEIIQRLPYKPHEIVVYAPDIQPYAASIEWVFKHRGGPFHYSITGLEALTHSPFLQGLQFLLDLPKLRYSKDGFYKLLFSAPFLKRFNLSIEEAETLSNWMKELCVRYDLRGHENAWHAALCRQVISLAVSTDVDFSDAPLINRWIEITQLLENELAPIVDGKERSGQEWADWIARWLEIFLESDEKPEIIHNFIATLGKERIEGHFSYASIESHLKIALTTRVGSMHGFNCETVRFTSLKEGSIIPAKVIICMGMQEGSFPRPTLTSSLSLFPEPPRSIEDQYLFLQVISQAEEQLIFTYQKYHPEDGKEVLPSSLIQQLIKDRQGILQFHPPLNYGKQPTTNVNQPLIDHPSLPSKSHACLDIRLLKKFARHPVQCFLEESAQLEIPFKKSDSEFVFSRIEMHHIRNAALKKRAGQIIDELSQQGKLPIGSFRKMAVGWLEKEIESYQNNLSKLGIDPASIAKLELTPYASKIQQLSPEHIIAPPVCISRGNGETVYLQGRLEGVCPQGFLFHGEESTEDLLKAWPLFNIVRTLFENASLFLTDKGTPAKLDVPHPHNALTRYVDYFYKGLSTPSPLLPAWGNRILKGGDLPKTTEDPTIGWADRRQLLPSRDIWLSEWRDYLKEVMHELL